MAKMDYTSEFQFRNCDYEMDTNEMELWKSYCLHEDNKDYGQLIIEHWKWIYQGKTYPMTYIFESRKDNLYGAIFIEDEIVMTRWGSDLKSKSLKFSEFHDVERRAAFAHVSRSLSSNGIYCTLHQRCVETHSQYVRGILKECGL